MARKMILLLTLSSCILIFLTSQNMTSPGEKTIYNEALEKTCPEATDINCLEKTVVNAVLKNGLEEGFRMIRAHYDAKPEFRPNCHALALRVGKSLGYLEVDYSKLSYTPESTWCNYGFYQAYPEVLLLSGAKINYVLEFCKYVGDKLSDTVPGVKGECFRGIGRALPFLNKTDQGDMRRMAAFATNTCKAISPNTTAYVNCTSGVFNKLGRAAVAATNNLLVDPADPLKLCSEQPKDLQISCYGNMHWIPFSFVDHTGNFSDELHNAVNTFSTTSTVTILETIWTIGYEAGRKSVAGDDTGVALSRACASLPPDLQTRCIQGISTGLAKHGVPGKQHERVIEFCAVASNNFPSIKKGDCLKPAIFYLRGFYSPPKFSQACIAFTSRLGVSC